MEVVVVFIEIDERKPGCTHSLELIGVKKKEKGMGKVKRNEPCCSQPVYVDVERGIPAQTMMIMMTMISSWRDGRLGLSDLAGFQKWWRSSTWKTGEEECHTDGTAGTVVTVKKAAFKNSQ